MVNSVGIMINADVNVKRLIDKLVEECSENIDGNEMIGVTLNEYKNVCGPFTMYIVLLAFFFHNKHNH